ncbi:hypothetical protein AVEN_212864-1 [Araneus ventricosus]|uniref:Uncharacterized protein n=1 Tax=Araneus ventricosus TaxID=182803 RepID=A0A4Y2F443_ARAVE|nr:hypothetical protein AVEN_212864-1 [Araneus ventricosus]
MQLDCQTAVKPAAFRLLPKIRCRAPPNTTRGRVRRKKKRVASSAPLNTDAAPTSQLRTELGPHWSRVEEERGHRLLPTFPLKNRHLANRRPDVPRASFPPPFPSLGLRKSEYS